MFGENPIEGQTILKIDKTDRITLPSFTGAEPGEEICSMIDPHFERLILLREKDLYEKLQGYLERAKTARELKLISGEDFRNLQRFFYAILPQAEKNFNQKLQFWLYSKRKENCYDVKELRRLNFRPDQVFSVGVGHTLEIYKDEESYQYSLKMDAERKAKRDEFDKKVASMRQGNV